MQTTYDKQSRMVVRRDADNYTALPNNGTAVDLAWVNFEEACDEHFDSTTADAFDSPVGGLMISPPTAGGVNNMRRLSPFCARL